jgi:hypothetical protein
VTPKVARQPSIALLLVGSLAWVAGSAFLVGGADVLARGVWYDPDLLALAHLIGLGFLSVAIAGVLLHIAPAMSSRAPIGGAWSGGLLATGAWLLAIGLWRDWTALEALGGGSASAGALLLVAGIARVWSGRRGTWPEAVAGLAVAAGWLTLVVVLGLLMVVERHSPFLGVDRGRLVATHAAVAVLGWVGGSVLAVGTRMAPMMLVAPVRRVWLARAALLAWHPGVALLALGLARGSRAAVDAGVALLVAGLLAFGAYLAVTAARRRRRPQAPAVHLALGLGGLMLAGGLELAHADRTAPAALVLGLIGFGGGATAGHALLLLPTMCWRERFGGLRVGGGVAPPVSFLAPPWLAAIEVAGFVGGLALLVLGVLGASVLAATMGGALVMTSAIVTLAAMLWAILRPVPARWTSARPLDIARMGGDSLRDGRPTSRGQAKQA